MRLLIITDDVCDSELNQSEMLKTLVESGLDITAVGFDAECGYPLRGLGVTYKQVHYDRTRMNLMRNIGLLQRYREAIRNIRPDRVFVHGFNQAILGLIAASVEGVAEMFAMIPDSDNQSLETAIRARSIRMHRQIYRIALRKVEKVFFQDTGDKVEFLAQRIVRGEQAMLVDVGGTYMAMYLMTPLYKPRMKLAEQAT